MDVNEAKLLIKLARDSIKTMFSGEKLDLVDTERFNKKQGVFVTLKLYEKLRGCIGFPQPVYSLQRAVIESARAAAFGDPRFSNLSEDEFYDITVEISVLSVPKLIEVKTADEYLDNIKIGKHGLIIKKFNHSGLLLPQVFSEYECTPKEALEMTCEKAGLNKDEWKNNSKLYRFSAEVFYETEPYGEVIKG